MMARIINNNDLILDNMTTPEEDVVIERFTVIDNSTYINPDAGGYNGVFKRYNRQTRRLARPFLGELRAVCAANKIPLVVKDERLPWKYKIAAQEDITPNYLAGITLDDYQIESIKVGCRVEVCIFDIPTGGGKCLGAGTPVLMWDGTIKPVQDVVPGDCLMGDNGTPRTVLSTCSGEDDLYEVSQKNGDSYIVNSAHIISLTRTPDGKSPAMDYAKIDMPLMDYLASSRTAKHLLKGYKAPVHWFGEQPEPTIDPYLLGLWLGDGVSVDTQFSLCKGPDDIIIDYLTAYCQSNGYVLVKYEEKREASDIYAIRLYAGIIRPEHVAPQQVNPLKAAMRGHDLFSNKHIPAAFKYGSVDTRLKVLAGLIDSDGYTNERNDTYYITIKKTKLVEDIVFLARSLGFRVTCRDTYKKWATEGEGAYYARITISGHVSTVPVLIESKKAVRRRMKKDPLVYGISIRPVGCGKYYGFEIDGNKRFLLGDFTVTHNTEVMAGLCKAIKCPTVILADQRIVIDQIKQRLELREIVDEVGLFYAGQTPDNQLVIAGSVQSLNIPSRVPAPPQESDAYSKAKILVAKDPEKFGLEANDDTAAFEKAVNKLADKIHIGNNKKHASVLKGFRKRKKRAKQFQAIVKKCEMIIVDECDLAGNNTQYKSVFRHYFTGRRRYGFSGTPFDPEKPVDGLFVQEHLGSVMMKVERRELEAKGRIVPIEYIMFALGNTPMERSAFDIAVRERMVENVEFHTIIKLICQQYKDEKSLVLVERDPLGKALEAAIPGSVFIHGKTPKRRRNEVLRAFEKGEIRVVIGGKILRRGLDLKGGCENLILATGGKLWSTINQQIGRAVRINKRGFGRVIDFLLLYNKYLYKHSRARLRAVVGMGYKTKVVFPDGNKVEGGNFLVTGYRKAKPRTQIGQSIGPGRHRLGREAAQPDDSF